MGSYMLIEKKKTVEMLPAEYNPRKDLKPGDEEYEKLKRSIEEFGYVEPVIWNKTTGRVVGGHQRLKVLIDLGITEVDCVVVEIRFLLFYGKACDRPIFPGTQNHAARAYAERHSGFLSIKILIIPKNP